MRRPLLAGWGGVFVASAWLRVRLGAPSLPRSSAERRASAVPSESWTGKPCVPHDARTASLTHWLSKAISRALRASEFLLQVGEELRVPARVASPRLAALWPFLFPPRNRCLGHVNVGSDITKREACGETQLFA